MATHSQALRTKATREILRQRRDRTFDALKSIICPDGKWQDLLTKLGKIVDLENSQLYNIRSGQRNLPEEGCTKLQNYLLQLRKKHQQDTLMMALFEDIDLSQLVSFHGEERAKLQDEVRDWLAVNYGAQDVTPRREEVETLVPTVQRPETPVVSHPFVIAQLTPEQVPMLLTAVHPRTEIVVEISDCGAANQVTIALP